MEKDFVKLYSITDLAKKEKRNRLTIRNGKKYIKVRYTTARSRASYKSGETKTPYTYKYMRWEDVKEIAEKQFGKRIIFS